MTAKPIGDLQEFIDGLKLTNQQQLIGKQVLKEIRARIGFLVDVGLDYLSLSRATATLSGGEAQRIRLATQIGSGLVGVCYILDEPSIGLHQRDNGKLIRTLKNLKELGNTLLVVEHDEDTMFAADHIIDIGPGAGEHGGEVIATGTAEEIMKVPESITGQYLSGAIQIPVPSVRKKGKGYIKIIGAKENNLKNITAKIPLGVMTCITGVSGSGKSSLVNEILYKKLATELSKRATGKTIYILDEPTTGLHFADVHKLTKILERLSESGNTVVVIEHNLDVIKTADYIIDIGPEGGNKGGYIVAEGTPEKVAKNENSYTGQYIKQMLQKGS